MESLTLYQLRQLDCHNNHKAVNYIFAGKPEVQNNQHPTTVGALVDCCSSFFKWWVKILSRLHTQMKYIIWCIMQCHKVGSYETGIRQLYGCLDRGRVSPLPVTRGFFWNFYEVNANSWSGLRTSAWLRKTTPGCGEVLTQCWCWPDMTFSPLDVTFEFASFSSLSSFPWTQTQTQMPSAPSMLILFF